MPPHLHQSHGDNLGTAKRGQKTSGCSVWCRTSAAPCQEHCPYAPVAQLFPSLGCALCSQPQSLHSSPTNQASIILDHKPYRSRTEFLKLQRVSSAPRGENSAHSAEGTILGHRKTSVVLGQEGWGTAQGEGQRRSPGHLHNFVCHLS